MKTLYMPTGQTFQQWYDAQPAPRPHINTVRKRFVNGYPLAGLLRTAVAAEQHVHVVDPEIKPYTLSDGRIVHGLHAIIEIIPALVPDPNEAIRRRDLQPAWATRKVREMLYRDASDQGYQADFLLDDTDPRWRASRSLEDYRLLLKDEGVHLRGGNLRPYSGTFKQ